MDTQHTAITTSLDHVSLSQAKPGTICLLQKDIVKVVEQSSKKGKRNSKELLISMSRKFLTSAYMIFRKSLFNLSIKQ